MKADLRDVTFMIPIQIDSIVRLENVLACIRYLLQHFDTYILLLEAQPFNNGVLQRLIPAKVWYVFVEDEDTVFYRTKYLNEMTRQSGMPFLGIWDADVIIPKEQILDAVQKLRENYEVAYPYQEDCFLDTTDIIRKLFLMRKNIQVLKRNRDKMYLIYGKGMKGGAILVNREAYKSRYGK